MQNGSIYSIGLGQSSGLFLVGKRCSFKFRHKIELGRSVTIEDGVTINALSRKGVKIGNNVSILRNTEIDCTGVMRAIGEGLEIGDNVGIAQNCFIQVRGYVKIGENVILGPNVSIFSENHKYSDINIPISMQGESRKGVEIERGAWIGSGATIIDGVIVGENSVVASGSVVTKHVPAFSVVGGVPAKILKRI